MNPSDTDSNAVVMSVEGITKNFGGLTAVSNLSFLVKQGEVLGIVGPNGAGKTTLFNLISGYHSCDSGKVLMGDCRIEGMAPHQIASLGVARTFQSLQIFSNLTALENVMVGRHLHTHVGLFSALLRLPRVATEERRVRADAMEYLTEFELGSRAYELASSLSFGEQRRLEICRALASDPKVLLLDEPCAGLTQDERTRLVAVISEIRQRGVAVLLVEHDVDLVMDLADRVLVLDYGSLIAEGPPDAVQRDQRVIDAYLGTGWEDLYTSGQAR